MNALDIIMSAMKTNAGFEFLNEIIIAALEDSRDICIEERERLDNLKYKEPHQEEDWECLVQDIYAFNRIIKYYGG
jgi:hypothetical protein